MRILLHELLQVLLSVFKYQIEFIIRANDINQIDNVWMLYLPEQRDFTYGSRRHTFLLNLITVQTDQYTYL